jgi:hypothetical protein
LQTETIRTTIRAPEFNRLDPDFDQGRIAGALMFVRALMTVAVLTYCWTVLPVATAAEPVRYSTQVAPLLQKYCVSCHSRVDAQNGLSLQAPDDILKGSENGPVLNESAADKSRLLEVLVSAGDDHMPPADEAQLSKDELAVLTQWLHEGGKFDSRMAVLPTLPKVAVTASKVRSPALAMALSKDGKTILSGRFKLVEQRRVENNELVWSLPIADGKVNSLRLSPDGTRVLLATGTPGLAGRAVEVVIGQNSIQKEFAGHNDILYSADWSPDGKIVATAGYDRRIILHNSETGEKIREMTGHNGAVFDLRFSPDGKLLASASADATIKIWNVATGERFDTLSQPQAEQYSVVFTPDNRFVLGAGADSRIRKWQLVSIDGPQINPLIISRFAHEGVITRMAISDDGRYLVTTSDMGSIKTWDAATVNEQSAENLTQDLVTSLAIDSENARVLISTSKGEQRSVALPEIASKTEASDAVAVVIMAEAAGPLAELTEMEPNSELAVAQAVPFPANISGVIDGATSGSDEDQFRFEAKKGQPILIEVKASRDKSALDSTVEVVTPDGKPVLQTQLQAVRDSYFTFRGKDSDTADDFRVFNWQEMELNEYLYADGEVVKLWLYPRGPDSGFKVYPGATLRQTYFGTTPTSHPLQGPAFIVVPYPADVVLKDTGLPIFPIYSQNDDDSMRQWGKDSRLTFVPPADGTYVVRLKDARGFQGADYKYQLMLRHPQPDFNIAMAGDALSIHKGTGREIIFTATRLDGYDGPIEIFAENLPAGFTLSDPVIIQPEQRQAMAILIASNDAVQPAEDAVKGVIFKARARIGDKDVIHDVGGLKTLAIAEKPKISVRILTAEQQAAGQNEHTPELTVWAGETVRAFLKVDRLDHTGLVEFGKEDSGRNMPHGVFVDNIGLNGLMLLEGQNEREFFITTAKWVPESSRPFYLKSSVDGITTLPVMLHIRHRSSDAPKTAAK